MPRHDQSAQRGHVPHLLAVAFRHAHQHVQDRRVICRTGDLRLDPGAAQRRSPANAGRGTRQGFTRFGLRLALEHGPHALKVLSRRRADAEQQVSCFSSSQWICRHFDLGRTPSGKGCRVRGRKLSFPRAAPERRQHRPLAAVVSAARGLRRIEHRIQRHQHNRPHMPGPRPRSPPRRDRRRRAIEHKRNSQHRQSRPALAALQLGLGAGHPPALGAGHARRVA